MAKLAALWCIIQTWAPAVQHNPGCKLAGQGSRVVPVERQAVVGKGAAEGTLAVQA